MTARVHHARLWGSRQAKYDWLSNHDAVDTHWQTVRPEEPFYLFTPQDTRLLAEHQAGWKIGDAMPVNSVGVVTGQDAKTIAFEEEPARSLAVDLRLSPACVQPILYRPFDIRFIVYDSSVVTRPRTDVMRHMLAGENLGLIFMRQVALQEDYSHFGVTRVMVDNRAFYSNKGIMSLAPLYLYPERGKMLESSPWPAGKDGRRPNLTPEFVETFAGKLGMKFVPDGKGDFRKTFGPEDVFHYAYAVFHSPKYRIRYAEFLKIDFPRLPLTGEKNLFAALARLWRQLTALHLLENVPTPAARYPREGDNVVRRADFKPPTSEIPNLKSQISDLKSQIPDSPGRVYINDLQYFDSVPPEVWTFHVGGYQVCQKWLKDRKGRCLSYDDIEHYRKMTEAVRQTLRLMDEIDRAIPAWPLT